MKRNLVIGAIAAVLVAAVGLAAWRWTPAPFFAPAQPPNAAKPGAAPAPSAPSAEAAATPAPSFDVVRVSPQGNAVIAGRAAPGAEVSVLDGNRVVGKATADDHGEWVLVPKEPLPPGDHQLSLTARSPKDGSTSKSEGVVAMLVPDHAKPNASSSDSVAVLVPREGDGPARPLQLPGGVLARGMLSLDIIEYDGAGKVQLLGRADPDARIEGSLNGKTAGRGVTNAAGDWTVTLDRPVPVGRYRLGLKALDAKGREIAQLALTFNRVAPPEGALAVDVQPGNNLWRIAQRSYGEGLRYTEIYQANRKQIRDPDLIYPGQVFAIPSRR